MSRKGGGGVKIKEIVTDRHVQIVKYIREELPEHDGYLYDACPNGPLKGTERHKKWFKPGNEVYNISTFKAQFLNVSVLNEFVSIL